MGRADLIGSGKHQLIPAYQPKVEGYQAARRKNSTPPGSKKVGRLLTQHTGLPPRGSDGGQPWDKREQAKAAAFARLDEQRKSGKGGAKGKRRPVSPR